MVSRPRLPVEAKEIAVWRALFAGIYVPTVAPAVLQWPLRKPWLMTSPAQFRPGPPLAPTSEAWARDYAFWRPVTAIRNGDLDGSDASERDRSWTPFIDTPMHPEYPCAHGIVAGAVGTVLEAELGNGPVPTLTTISDTADGAVRSWTKVDDFMEEVANACIYDGVTTAPPIRSARPWANRAGGREVPEAARVTRAPGAREPARLRPDAC